MRKSSLRSLTLLLKNIRWIICHHSLCFNCPKGKNNYHQISKLVYNCVCVCRFSTNDTLLNKYNYNMKSKSEDADKTCNSTCRKDRICDLSNIISRNALLCRIS